MSRCLTKHRDGFIYLQALISLVDHVLVFRVMTPYELVGCVDVLNEPAASIFRAQESLLGMCVYIVYIQIVIFSPNPLCPSKCRQYIPLSACTRLPDNTVSQYESSPSASCSIEQLFSSRFSFTLCCIEWVQKCLWNVTQFRWCLTFRSIMVHCLLWKRPTPTTAYPTAQCSRLQ